jgi:glycosyltransferase involved in cell wall biosynthesis/SAM-dependent methyltransferase
MRILFVVHGFPPHDMAGTELYTYYLAQALRELGHEVVVFHRVANPDAPEYELTEGQYEGLTVLRINNTWRYARGFSMTYKNDTIDAQFSSLLERVKPDVVHFQHLTCLSTSLIHICREKRIPIVFTLHDYWMLCPRGQLLRSDLSLCTGPGDRECADCLSVQINALLGSLSKNRFLKAAIEQKSSPLGNILVGIGRLYARLNVQLNQRRAVQLLKDRSRHVRQMLQEADLLIAPSRFHRAQFIKFGVPADKIIFSADGLNTRLFAGFQKTQSDKLRFGFIGTIIPSKGLHVLIEAFNLIEGDKATLSIYGGALPYDGYEDYPRELRDMAVNPHIKFMGGYDNAQIAAILSGIDVVVVPSIWYESFSLTVHEAFAAKIPVIASNLGAMAEYVQHEKNGLLFEPRNAADLRSQILRLIENPGLVEALRANIPAVKSIEENAAEMETIYRQLYQQRATGGIIVPQPLTNRAAAAGGELAEARQSLELYQKLNWMESPLIAGPYINRQISGDPADNWMIWVRKALVPNKLGRGLSLGCGEGCLERHATSLGICEAFDAFDISAQAIAIARAKAAQEGCAHIHYEVRDVNKIQLPPEHYDIAFAGSALHHIASLEHVLDEVHKALKPGCFFIANEFVGPSRFQWTDKQLQIINELLALLPPRYRADLRRPGQIKSRVDRPTVAQMLLSDPSEAVRSAEIIPLIQQRFEIVQQTDFGGTILHMLLSDIVGNFDPASEVDATIIRLLCYLEKTLIAEGVLPSDFTLIVARKQVAPAARGGAP